MLVFGDRSHRHDVAATLRTVATTGDFILGAELAQGLVDAEFEVRGADDLTPLHDAAMHMLRSSARGAADISRLLALDLPRAVEAREAEGHAFYAVYPEAYRRAAAEVCWDEAPLVIGLRSIGLGLAAMVAEGAGAQTVISVRPLGPPFRRELRLAEPLRRRLAEHRGPFAVVDEGPGLSGSSFGAVLDLLEAMGVELGRIVVFPSHSGDLGPHALPRHRSRWRAVSRRPATWRPEPQAIFADLTGPATKVEDLSGGAWRAGRPLPAFGQQERLKIRITGASDTWVARFAGLGRTGRGKFERARALHAAGFAPEPIGFRDGWLLSRWEPGRPGRPRLERLADYLRFRGREFQGGVGAGLEQLSEMIRVNAQALGVAVDPTPPSAQPDPVYTDGRLHAWEWLRTPDGRMLKTDALDHACAHDLVGCQDIAWDVAGAAVELQLTAPQTEALASAVGARRELTAFYALAYPAFQAGLWTYAGEHAPVARYRHALETAARAQGFAGERSRTCPIPRTSIPATR